MKVDLHKIIKAVDGKPMKLDEKTDITLKFVALEALAAIIEEDRTASAADKVKNAALQIKIYGATGPIDLTSEEISFLKERIGKAIVGAIVVYRAHDLLEGN